MKKLDNLLIVKLSSLGDVLMNIPVVEGIEKSHENIKIGWVVEDRASDILKNYNTIDKLYILDKTKLDKNFNNHKFRTVYKQIREFIKKINKEEWTNSLDLQWLFRSSLIPFIAGIKNRYGCVRSGLQQFFVNNNYKFDDKNYPDHVIKKNFQIMKDIGFIKENIKPEIFFPLNEELKKWGEKRVEKFESNTKIGLAPFSKWKSKNWPIEKYKKLADQLVESSNCSVFVFGGKENKEKAEKWFDFENKNIVNFVGNTSLNQFASIAKNMNVFMSGDSFPMHVAAFLNLNQIAIFGPTSFKKTGPVNSKAKIIQKEYECIPCFSKKCPLNNDKYRCLRNIKISKIKSLILNMINN